MKFQTIITKSLSAISRRVSTAAINKTVEIKNQGNDKSSYQVTTSFHVITVEIKKELSDLTDKISSVGISYMELQKIEGRVISFIIDEFEKHKSYLGNTNRFWQNNKSKFNSFLDDEIDDVTSAFNIRMLVLKQNAKSRRRKALWEIGKMVLSGIIGGLITLYLRIKFSP
ncbi:hypothetical protein [Paenibacillus durus]|uniref:Uncharacterized protein n=1 Tax=Paenibacillus durus ATCC 35681 TaxID=1333534 RepID=A0A0F7F9G6_PAEDU|nr:hypothetical protein [Paenibacillus durus]AKG34668.1 hypothetical protein VK70_08830 [Paenibacillus durus ATCC 35681]